MHVVTTLTYKIYLFNNIGLYLLPSFWLVTFEPFNVSIKRCILDIRQFHFQNKNLTLFPTFVCGNCRKKLLEQDKDYKNKKRKKGSLLTAENYQQLICRENFLTCTSNYIEHSHEDCALCLKYPDLIEKHSENQISHGSYREQNFPSSQESSIDISFNSQDSTVNADQDVSITASTPKKIHTSSTLSLREAKKKCINEDIGYMYLGRTPFPLIRTKKKGNFSVLLDPSFLSLLKYTWKGQNRTYMMTFYIVSGCQTF